MKRVFATVMAFLMVLLSMSAVFADQVFPFTGTWYLNKLVDGDDMLLASSVSINGILVLNKDCSVEYDLSGHMYTGYWQIDNDGHLSITISGNETASATYSDSELQLISSGQGIIFTREQPEVIRVADVNPNAAAEDFAGNWKCKYVGYNGLIMDALVAEANNEVLPTVVFENDSLLMTGGSFGELSGDEPMPMEYKDGSYSCSFNIEELTVTFTLSMLQDGMLSLSLNLGGNVILYFIRDDAPDPEALEAERQAVSPTDNVTDNTNKTDLIPAE